MSLIQLFHQAYDFEAKYRILSEFTVLTKNDLVKINKRFYGSTKRFLVSLACLI